MRLVYADEPYEVAIVGGGPAGVAAALALAGRRVLLLERARHPRPKSCGDAIPSQALDELEGLRPGTRAQLERLPSAGAVKGARLVSPLGASVSVRFSRPGLNIARDEFDAALFALLEGQPGLELSHDALVGLSKGRPGVDAGLGGHTLHLSTGLRVRARVIIGADGAYSLVRRRLVPTLVPDHYLAVATRTYVPTPGGGPTTAPDELLIAFPGALLPGYLWAFALGDGRTNLGVGRLMRGREQPRHALKPLAEGYLMRPPRWLLPYVAPQAGPPAAGWLGHMLPLARAGAPLTAAGVCLVGDAACLVYPATGEGIANAVLSGRLAGEHLKALFETGRDPTAEALAPYGADLMGRIMPMVHRHTRAVSLAGRMPWLIEGAVAGARLWPGLRRRLGSF